MNKFTPLPRRFYEPSAAVVAPRLLGHWLVHRTKQGVCAGAIVEVEAYIVGDAACHAFRGETPRTKVMFGPPGHSYVYYIYGNHWCFNVVCQPAGTAEAVLIRAVEPTLGLDLMRERRPVVNPHHLTNGPGKLCVAMGIDRTLNEVDLCAANSPLFIAKNPALKSYLEESGPMVTTTRIGIKVAAALPLRFYLAGSPYVSKRVILQ